MADITKAYEKDPNLESLLFDDFFNKGKRVSVSLHSIMFFYWVFF